MQPDRPQARNGPSISRADVYLTITFLSLVVGSNHVVMMEAQLGPITYGDCPIPLSSFEKPEHVTCVFQRVA